MNAHESSPKDVGIQNMIPSLMSISLQTEEYNEEEEEEEIGVKPLYKNTKIGNS